METTEIIRIFVEILIAGLTWYLKNKLTKSEKARIKESEEYELKIHNLRFVNKELTKKLVNQDK